MKFTFTAAFDTGIRLKHILEDKVDEKYYIDTPKTQELIKQLIIEDDLKPEQTNRIKQIGSIMTSGNRNNPNQGRVYDPEYLAPTIGKMEGGGRQPFIPFKESD